MFIICDQLEMQKSFQTLRCNLPPLYLAKPFDSVNDFYQIQKTKHGQLFKHDVIVVVWFYRMFSEEIFLT